MHPLKLADAPVHGVLQKHWLPQDCRVGENLDLLPAWAHSLNQKLVLDLEECLVDGDGQIADAKRTVSTPSTQYVSWGRHMY